MFGRKMAVAEMGVAVADSPEPNNARYVVYLLHCAAGPQLSYSSFYFSITTSGFLVFIC
jgi:hypothetical protein